MRRYLLDTPVVAAYLNSRQKAVELVQPWLRRGEAATSIVVYGEVIEYIKSVPNYGERQSELRDLLVEIRPYHLTYPILERYADLRRQLRPPYGRGLIGDMDTLIAATAMERNLTVVTTDGDYERVVGLKVMLVRVK